MEKEIDGVGRGSECGRVVPERQVSREHIKIKLIDGQYMIEDLDRKTGTWVNGQQLKGERPLRDGDEVHIALAVKFTFIESEATAPLNINDNPAAMKGNLRLDRESRRVYISNREIDPPLSLPQYRLLEMLMNSKGAVCTRDHVLEAVWPEAGGEGRREQAIDALVGRLRGRFRGVGH